MGRAYKSNGVRATISGGWDSKHQVARQFTVLAIRPEVLPFIIEFNPAKQWGCWLLVAGTQEELIVAGLAHPDMFQDIGKSRQRQGPDEFGCQFSIRRRRGGRYEITRFLKEDPQYGDPSDDPKHWLKFQRECMPDVCVIVSDALARIVKEATHASESAGTNRER